MLQLEISLLVTNETAGGLIGTCQTKSGVGPFTARVSQLERLPPSSYASAVAKPSGNSEMVKFQVQNFGASGVVVATGSLAQYISKGWKRKILMPDQLAEFAIKADEQLLLIPHFPPPPGFQAREFEYNTNGWKPHGVHLKWDLLQGIGTYRLHKLVLLKKGSEDWTLYQKWHCDVSGNEFHDSDLTP